MIFSIGFASMLVWLTAIILASLGIVVLFGNRSLMSRAFANFLLWGSLWLASHGLFHSANEIAAQNLIKSNYFFGGALAAAFFYFALVFPEGKKPKWWVIPLLIASQILLGGLYLFTNTIVYGAISIQSLGHWGWYFGSLSILFDFFFYLYWCGGLGLLFRKFWKKEKGSVERIHLKYVLIAMIISISPTSIMNILLPKLGYFSLDWIGAVTVLNFVIVIAYSIIKYNQMDVKAVAAEVLVLVMVIVLFANIFTSATL
ncbi:MAG: hypothetical protein V1652_00555, partial [bacterium]